ncbi:protein kinase [Schistosoma mansoni]|uniref:protein kinase n=1 Tax=Schistosoma mansoni TaxID=6183 RepID=UPI0001A644D4|nr:protein kinase [Schistosoma mansoni]|eukprot:XP_018653220.1 protein kinase [Schistosoma mansoni]
MLKGKVFVVYKNHKPSTNYIESQIRQVFTEKFVALTLFQSEFAYDSNDLDIVKMETKCFQVQYPQFHLPIAKFLSCVQNQYLLDNFDPLVFIGDGGFGTVYKTRHKIDGKVYAIKKISGSRPRDTLELARSEVYTMSRLNHVNIVRYITSWLDYEWISVESNSEVSNCNLTSTCTNNYLTHPSTIMNIKHIKSRNNRTPVKSSFNTLLTPNKFNDSWEINENPATNALSLPDERRKKKRRNNLKVDTSSDIKALVPNKELIPVNHFELTIVDSSNNSNVYQTNDNSDEKHLLLSKYKPITTTTTHKILFYLTADLGSSIYTAPEVQNHCKNKSHQRTLYNYKVDIYSLGVIFFEMLHPCFTRSELITYLEQFINASSLTNYRNMNNQNISNDVTNQCNINIHTKHGIMDYLLDIFPRSMLSTWPYESQLVARMLNLHVQYRPNAMEILEILSVNSEFPDLGENRITVDASNSSVDIVSKNLKIESTIHEDKKVSYPLKGNFLNYQLIDYLVWRNRELEQKLHETQERLSMYEKADKIENV